MVDDVAESQLPGRYGAESFQKHRRARAKLFLRKIRTLHNKSSS